MFCKWCGSDYQKGTKKCSRCGREIPAQSDCGGFYDLVPNAKMPPANATVLPASAAPEAPAAPAVEEKPLGELSAAGTGRVNLNPLLAILCVVLAAAVLVLLWTGRNKKDKKVDTGEKPGIGALVEGKETEGTDESKPAEATTPEEKAEEENAPKLAVHEISFDAVIKDGAMAESNANLGEFQGEATMEATFGEDKLLAQVIVKLGEDELLTVNIERDTNLLKKKTLALDIDIKDKQLGEEKEEECQWFYREKDSEEWKALDKEQMDENKLKLGDEKAADYKVVYTRTNEEGGKMTITISGITVEK